MADIESVETELYEEVTKQVNLEAQLGDQVKKVQILKDHKNKLSRALDILEGREPVKSEPRVASDGSPVSMPPSSEKPAEAPAIKPPYTGPICGACGARMYETYRTVPSGITVRLLKCEDSACNNEQY
jgi:hypothetical protein